MQNYWVSLTSCSSICTPYVQDLSCPIQLYQGSLQELDKSYLWRGVRGPARPLELGGFSMHRGAFWAILGYFRANILILLTMLIFNFQGYIFILLTMLIFSFQGHYHNFQALFDIFQVLFDIFQCKRKNQALFKDTIDFQALFKACAHPVYNINS